MPNPVLMVVDGNPSTLATLDGTLRRRYENDYLIKLDAPGHAASARCGPAGQNPEDSA